MKVFRNVFFFTFLFSLTSFISNAQVNYYIPYFNITEHDGAIIIQFTTEVGFSCENIQIYRKSSNNQFELLHTFYGVCGIIDRRQSYIFTDENPKINIENSYYLDLGPYGLSNTLSLTPKGSLPQKSFAVPNPIEENSILYFDNKKNNTVTLNFFSLDGSLQEQHETNKDFFAMNQLNHFSNYKGIVFYTIRFKDDVLFSGKLIFP